MRNEELGMRNIKREKSKIVLLYSLLLAICYLFPACDNNFDTPDIGKPVANGYGKISIVFVGEDTARTVLPSTVFDKYVYTFIKAGEGSGVEKAPDNEGFFTLEIGSYTVAVQAYIGNTGSYTLVASGTSSQFNIGSGNNNPIVVRLSGVAAGTEGKFSYTITIPENAAAEITLQKWPDMNDITLNPVNISQGNGKTETLELGIGSYLLTVLVSKNELYAGIIEIIHIYPALSTVYTKIFTDDDLLAPLPITNVEIIVTAPTMGVAPNTTAIGVGNFIIGAVSWSPANNPFFGNTVYTATVTLTASSRYTFNGLNKATINGQNAVVSNNNGKAVKLSYTFPATEDRTVTNMEIITQPDNMIYTHGDTLNLTGLVLSLTYDDTTTEDVAASSFASKNITANPSHGNNLVCSTYNGQSVKINYGDLPTLNTDNLTVNPKIITFTIDEIPAQTYTGSPIQPAITVRDGSAILTAADYTVTYSNNTNTGYASVTINGAGNYAGSTGSKTFRINPKVITFTVDEIPAQTYTGSPIQQPAVTVRDDTTILTAADYRVEYGLIINVGTGGIFVIGRGNYAGSTGSKSFIVNSKVITFGVDTIPAQMYTGNTVMPAVTVKDGTTMLTLNTDFTVVYANNINTGTATVTINGVGNYAGSTGSSTFTICFIVMVYVPGGSFEMGDVKNEGAIGAYEKPVHTVTLSGFYMGKYEVTQAQYQAVMGSNPSNANSPIASGDTQEYRPVDNVSWYDAIEFCNALSKKEGLSPYYTINKVSKDPNNNNDYDTMKWTVTRNNVANGYRLPTEAQWEYAAKGGNGSPGNYTYSGSNTVEDVAWYGFNSGYRTHQVGTKAPNGLGIYDMSGNVDEWCWDWWGSYTNGAQSDPVGPSAGADRVFRSGGADKPTSEMRSAVRQRRAPFSNFGGFRVVRP